MKVIVFEDQEDCREKICISINSVAAKHNLNLEIEQATGNENKLLSIISNLEETAIFFIDIVIDGKPIGLEMIDAIYARQKSDFIIVLTQYPEKILFMAEYKCKTFNVIFKFRNESKHKTNWEHEVSETLCYIHKLIDLDTKNNYLVAKGAFNSIIRLEFDQILFIETYPKNRLKINYAAGEFIYKDTLKNIAKKLDSRFMRCSESYIINKNHVAKIITEERKIVFYNDQYCYFTQRYRKNVLYGVCEVYEFDD